MSFVSPKVRLVTLEILCLLDQYHTTDETTAYGGKVLATCLEVEKTETNLQNVRRFKANSLLQQITYVSTYYVFIQSKKKLMYLERLKYRSEAFKRIPDHYKEVCVELDSMLQYGYSTHTTALSIQL